MGFCDGYTGFIIGGRPVVVVGWVVVSLTGFLSSTHGPLNDLVKFCFFSILS